nr:hypothetical protein [Tanacetum cinerariifolium]
MRHSKELASPKQTALGKDISNLLMAGRLPKPTLPTSTMASAIICLATTRSSTSQGLIQDDVYSLSIPTEPSTSKPHKKHKSKKQQTQAPKVPSLEPSPKHKLPLHYNDPLPGGEDSLKLKELMDLCTHFMQDVDDEETADVEEVLEIVKAAKLMTKVVTTTGATTTAEVTKVSVLRRRRGVVIQDSKETTSTVVMHSEFQSKDKGK